MKTLNSQIPRSLLSILAITATSFHLIAQPNTLPAAPAGSTQTAAQPNTKLLTNSIRPVTTTPNAIGAYVFRAALTNTELSAPITIAVSLPFRNLAELKARVGNHDRLTIAQLHDSYLPLPDTYQRVAQWLGSQGLTVASEDPNHMIVTVSGAVSKVSVVFQTTFARVKTPEGEYTSAVTPPSIPSSIADAILGISGLQPHLKAHPQLIPSTNQQWTLYPFSHPQTPYLRSLDTYIMTSSDIRALYNAPSNLTGAGQTVAIVMSAPVSASDFAAYNSYTGNSFSGTFTEVNVGTPVPSSFNDNLCVPEANLDVEAVAGMAPGANIRLYTIQGLSDANIEAGLNQILSDITQNVANVTVISMSFGANEGYEYSTGALDTMDQIFLASTALGVTNVASSGDTGYIASGNAGDVYYPASRLSS